MRAVGILITVLILSNAADACSRCGSFRSCRFVKKKQAIIVQKAAPVVIPPTVLVFNNAGTVPQIISQGSTVYGSTTPSLNAQISQYQGDARDLLHLAELRSNGVSALATLAASQLASETEVNRLLGGAQSLATVINAARENTAALNAPRSFVVTVSSSGETRLESLQSYQTSQVQSTTTGQPAPATTTTQAAGTAGFLSTNCASCHGTDKASPEGEFFADDTASFSVESLKKVNVYIADPSTIGNEKMRNLFSGFSATDKLQLKLAIADRLE